MTFLVNFPSKLFASEYQTLKTTYITIYYLQDQVLSNFIWRISGKRINTPGDFSLGKNAVDRIIERVQSILDMHPDNFHIDIYLHPIYTEGMIAFYEHNKRTITVYADRVTDGVLAHEIAHAVINSYFDIPPPKKIQEILAHYVDRYLWADY